VTAGDEPDDGGDDGANEKRVKDAGEVRGAEVPEERGELVKCGEKTELQGNKPEEDEETFLLRRFIDDEIEAEFVGHPEAGDQLERI
jgi:hypothetical protein